MTISEALQKAAEKIKEKSPSPQLDSEVILAHILKYRRSDLITNANEKLGWWQAKYLDYLIKKRSAGEPVAYITGHKEFYGRNFIINKNVLIPRPETELIIDEVLKILETDKIINAAIDVGTGSGCIAVTLAMESCLNITAIDISAQALRLAKKNAQQYKVGKRINFKRGNLLSSLINDKKGLSPQSMILANLPYLTNDEIVKDLRAEPRQALDGGPEGLKLYIKLLKQIHDLTKEYRSSYLILELHPPTASTVKNIIEKYLPKARLEIKNDLAGKPRLAVAKIN